MAAEQAARGAEEEAEREREKAKEKEGTATGQPPPPPAAKTAATDGKKTSKVRFS